MAAQAHLARTIKHIRLFGGAARGERAPLVVVRLRHLHEPHAVVSEVAEHAIEELRERNVVRIEDEHAEGLGDRVGVTRA